MRWTIAILLCLTLRGQVLREVPFVPCPADGQVGPQPAPAKASRRVHLPVGTASVLALYESKDASVLAPRGWTCFERYGSGGHWLIVAPANGGATGPAVVLAHRYGGTSGRFAVAELISRNFPRFLPFVTLVRKMYPDTAMTFSHGPFPDDGLTYRSDRVLEFRTRASSEGLGTFGGDIAPNASPVDGVAMVLGPVDQPDVEVVSIRLPEVTNHSNLVRAIIEDAEKRAPPIPAGRVMIPFVGCPVTGQIESDAPPNGMRPTPPHVAPAVARQLAFYSDRNGERATLAPRGWHCLALIGSSSHTLYVQPEPFPNSADVHPSFGLVTTSMLGSTIGRYRVADLIARYFLPTYRSFLDYVQSNNPDVPETYVYKPFPGDRVTYRSKSELAFTTAPGQEGLGTLAGLKAGAAPIQGIVRLHQEQGSPVVDVGITAVRLPSAAKHLQSLLLSGASR